MKKTLVNKILLFAAIVVALNFKASSQSVSYIGDFDLSNLQSFDGTPFSTIGYESIPEGITFSPNGLKMFVTGQSSDAVNQFSLSTPFNINSGVTSDGSYSVATQYTNPRAYDVAFSNDGLKMFVTGTAGNELTQYNLTTPFDVTSGVTYNTSYNLPTSGDPAFITFNDDGTKMYVRNGTGVGQFSLSVAFDIASTISLEGTYTPSTYAPEEAVFTADGMKMLVIEQSSDLIHQYDLTTAYEITSGVTDNSITFDVSGEDTFPSGLAISSDNASIFVMGLGSGNQRIRQYNMSITSFTESASNNGSVDGSVTISMYNDTFTNQGGTLTESTDYSITNLPSGLTPSIAVSGDGTSATLTLSGNSSNHQEGDGVEGLEIVFQNSAFTGNDASIVYNSDGQGLTPGIDFSSNKVVRYGNGFNLDHGISFDGSLYASTSLVEAYGLTFNSDGTKFYFVEQQGDRVFQFTLTDPYDISTATLDGNRGISDSETQPRDIVFSPDGTKMYVSGQSSDAINQYVLNTPHDITGGWTLEGSTSAGTNPTGFAFSTDGLKLIIQSGTSVTSHTLSEAHDITSTKTSIGGINISGNVANPWGMEMSPDGFKMFLLEFNGDAIHQYSLETAFDATSATYDGVSQTLSFLPGGIAFGLTTNTDGDQFYVLDYNTDYIRQYKITPSRLFESGANNGAIEGYASASITGGYFSNPGGTLIYNTDFTLSSLPSGLTPVLSVNSIGSAVTLTFTGNASGHMDSDDIADLEITFNNSAFSDNDASNLINPTGSLETGIDFRDNNPLISYGNAFNPIEASYSKSFFMGDEEQAPFGMSFNDDGTRMFMVGYYSDAVFQYDLSTPYDVSTASYNAISFSTADKETIPSGIRFNADGSKMFIVGTGDGNVNQYSLANPFDLSSGVTFDLAVSLNEGSSMSAISFSNEGLTMHIVDVYNDEINQYSLDAAYNISGATFEGSQNVSSYETNPTGLAISNDGKWLILSGSLTDRIRLFELDVPFDITAGLSQIDDVYVNSWDNSPHDINFNADGSKMYILGGSTGSVFEFDIDLGVFSENSKNDGSLAEFNAPIYLIDDKFTSAGGTLTYGVDFSINNLPAGLTASVTVDASGQVAELSLEGLANDHQNINDVPALNFTFSNSAFESGNASSVANSSTFDSGLGINFRDNNPILSYGNPLDMDFATQDGTLDLSSYGDYVGGIVFSNDGLKMFITVYGTGTVDQYSLTDPYVVTSGVTYIGAYDYSTQDGYAEDLAFSSGGTKFYILGSDNYTIYQYNLSTAFDITSGVTYSSNSFYFADFDDSVYGFTLSADGTKMYIGGTNNYEILQFSLSTANDISSVSYDGSLFVDEVSITGIKFSSDGQYVLMTSDNNYSAVRYKLFVPWDVTQGGTEQEIFDLDTSGIWPSGIGVSEDGSKVFIVDGNTYAILQYSIDLGNFAEASINDGSVEGSTSIYLLDDTFSNAGGTLAYGSDYSITNLPSGLSPVLTVAGDGYSVSLSFSGSASIHGDANDVANLQFNFSNSAFTNYSAAEVDNASNYDAPFGISFSPYIGTDILTFELAEQTGAAFIDNGESSTVTAEVIAGTDISALTPTIIVSTGATISPNSGVEQDFTAPITYTITAEDGGQATMEVTVTEALADPADILLTSTSINENGGINDAVGILSTLDESFDNTHTYALVAGTGDTDNASFNINGTELRASVSFDFETKSSYEIRIQTNDGEGGLFEEEIAITVNDVNETPMDITLDNITIDESNPAGTLVGQLIPVDEDLDDVHTFSLKETNTDNQSFAIDGDQLITSEILDFETKSVYNLEIIVMDQGGLFFEQEFAITVNDLPAQITSITLDNQSVNENELNSVRVGNFATSGEDLSGSYIYSLVAGVGDTDNASFSISGNQLFTTESFNFESQSSYSILIMSDDGSLTETQLFTINVNDVSEAPTDISLSGNSIVENNSIGDVIGNLSTTDEDAGESFTYVLVAGTGDAGNNAFTVVGNELRAATVFDFETQDTYSVRVETNDGNGGTHQKVFSISITNENESILVANPIADQDLDERFSTLDIDLGAVFNDQDGDELTYVVSSSNTGVVTVSETAGTLTITEAGAFGSATITVTADDGSGVTTSDVFIVTVSNVNDAPVVANAIADQTFEEGFASQDIDLTNTFSDEDGDAVTRIVVSSDVNVVTVAISGNTLTITEVGNGTSTITITGEDGNGGSVTDEFTVTVNNVNDAPVVANETADQTFEEGFASQEIDLTNTFSDEDGDTVTPSAVSSDVNVVTVAISGNTLIITEVGNGTSIITITGEDGNGGSVIDEFTVTVNNVNDAPVVANAIADQTFDEGFASQEIDLTNTFSDEDGDTVTPSAVSSDVNVVTVAISGNTLTITEVGNGTATITITADDGNGATGTDEFLIMVNNVNDAPIVANAIADQIEDEGFGSLNIDLTNSFSDAEGDVLTLSVVSSDESVAIAAISGTTLTLTEAGIGTSTITVTADDGNGGSVSDEFTITVNDIPNNVPTIANAIADQTEDEGYGSLNIDLANTFSDADGDVLTLSVVSSDENVAIAAISGTTLTLTEAGIGTSTITVTADDGNGGSVSDEFIITVTEVALGLEEKINLSIYPNPVTDFLKIETNEEVEATLSDLNGRILQLKDGRAIKIDVRSLSKGVYIITIEKNGESVRKRIIKAN